MASLAEIKELLENQKKEDVEEVKADILAMTTSLAAELRSELRDFVQIEIAKSTAIPGSKRKQAKTTHDMDGDQRLLHAGRGIIVGLLYGRSQGLLPSLGACPCASLASCRQRALWPSGQYRL